MSGILTNVFGSGIVNSDIDFSQFLTKHQAESLYVNENGDTMIGNLELNNSKLLFRDTNYINYNPKTEMIDINSTNGINLNNKRIQNVSNAMKENDAVALNQITPLLKNSKEYVEKVGKIPNLPGVDITLMKGEEKIIFIALWIEMKNKSWLNIHTNMSDSFFIFFKDTSISIWFTEYPIGWTENYKLEYFIDKNE